MVVFDFSILLFSLNSLNIPQDNQFYSPYSAPFPFSAIVYFQVKVLFVFFNGRDFSHMMRALRDSFLFEIALKVTVTQRIFDWCHKAGKLVSDNSEGNSCQKFEFIKLLIN